MRLFTLSMVARGDDGYLRGGQRPVGRIFAKEAARLITTTTTLSVLHTYERIVIVHTYIHTYTYGYHPFNSTGLCQPLQHLERARCVFIRQTGRKKNPAEMTSCTMHRILIYVQVQQRSLHSTVHTLPKTKTTYIHDTS